MQTEFDTIAAISTAPGEGAIGIVRISGEDAIRIADEVYRLKDKRLKEQPKSYDSLWAYCGSKER